MVDAIIDSRHWIRINGMFGDDECNFFFLNLWPDDFIWCHAVCILKIKLNVTYGHSVESWISSLAVASKELSAVAAYRPHRLSDICTKHSWTVDEFSKAERVCETSVTPFDLHSFCTYSKHAVCCTTRLPKKWQKSAVINLVNNMTFEKKQQLKVQLVYKNSVCTLQAEGWSSHTTSAQPVLATNSGPHWLQDHHASLLCSWPCAILFVWGVTLPARQVFSLSHVSGIRLSAIAHSLSLAPIFGMPCLSISPYSQY